MSINRRELLVDEKEVTVQTNENLEREILEEGTAFSQMKSTYGWKILMERYIGSKIDKNRFLIAKSEELQEVRASMRALQDLVDYVDRRINEAIKINERRRNT